MASYLKSIFRGRDTTSTSKSNGRRTNTSGSGGSRSRSRSSSESPTTSSPTKSKHFNYLYAEPGSVPPAPIQTATRERSNSLTASRAIAPSPLRYTFDNNIGRGAHSASHHTTHSLDGANTKVPLYRSSSHKAERPGLVQQPAFNPTSSFGSVRSSSQSIYSTNPAAHRYAPSRASSSNSVATQSTGHEPRSALKHNMSSGDNTKGSRHAHVSFQNPNRPTPVHMHPLLSYGRIHRAPISFDVIYPPSTRTIVDRHTHSPIPPCTLTQPATEPPTYGRFILKCDKLPWNIIATAGVDSANAGNGSVGRSSGKRFYIESTGSASSGTPRSSTSSGGFPEPITNLDVLHAIHTTLSVRVTQAEWDSLGNGSRAQRKATRAYEKRCTDMGGGWGAGVRRVDFLGGKSKLVGVEIATEKVAGNPVPFGKLVFSRP